ncbi:MAG: cobalt ECF transporter T component CbiQ [Ignavibacteriales bacterium]
MADLARSICEIRLMDDLARKKTVIHGIHPLAKTLATLVYVAVVASFGRYEVSKLLPLVFYPVVLFSLADLPLGPILKRIMLVEPFVILIGVLNPVFDHHVFVLGGVAVSRGWVTFLSILIKCSLTVAAALLLVATTGIDRLAQALRMLGVSRLLVLQLLLTYRYALLLMEEVDRTLRAYSLRAPGQRGVHRRCWGSLAGRIMLRTLDRAQRVYHAMCLRGFQGEYNTGDDRRIGAGDLAYVVVWASFFATSRLFDIPMLIGSLVVGVIR